MHGAGDGRRACLCAYPDRLSRVALSLDDAGFVWEQWALFCQRDDGSKSRGRLCSLLRNPGKEKMATDRKAKEAFLKPKHETRKFSRKS